MTNNSIFERARIWNRGMTPRIRAYLNGRGISDDVIERFLLGWDWRRITIPVVTRAGDQVHFRFAKDPDDTLPGPKVIGEAGVPADLYGWDAVQRKPRQLVLCEGEFDRLVLEGRGFPAATSTGGAGVFRKEWARALAPIPEVYVCFDRDKAGRRGAKRVARLLPRARIVELPEEVGPGGDVTDFFVRLGKSPEDFAALLRQARPLPPEKTPWAGPRPRPAPVGRGEAAELKARVRIEDLVGDYLELRKVGRAFVGRCPFHDDRHPSFVVYPETQSFYCFGCQVHGDAFEFLMRAESLTFPEAVQVLRRIA